MATLSESSLYHVTTMAFQVYRHSRLGVALLETILKELEAGRMDMNLGVALMQQFDHSVATALAHARVSQRQFFFRAGRMDYRVFQRDGLHMYLLQVRDFLTFSWPMLVIDFFLYRKWTCFARWSPERFTALSRRPGF
jgi:hypothetical protein